MIPETIAVAANTQITRSIPFPRSLRIVASSFIPVPFLASAFFLHLMLFSISFLSRKLIRFPINRTGCGIQYGSPNKQSSKKPLTNASICNVIVICLFPLPLPLQLVSVFLTAHCCFYRQLNFIALTIFYLIVIIITACKAAHYSHDRAAVNNTDCTFLFIIFHTFYTPFKSCH